MRLGGASDGDITVNASLAAIKCRNRFLSTPLDKATEANQRKVVELFKVWPDRLKRRNEIAERLRKDVDRYSKDVAALTGHTTEIRALVREAERAPLPRVKPQLLQEIKTLLMRAEH